ncbi:SIR2 family protein [Kordia sp.]|uniref:SIR2 family protein n=1 Tax=Kordia sp. TaxID=1965332 RepID=UPI0025BB7B0F|nr:SIR2 family protein [Kordia sp.]MCH2196268.1 SIR2 family protein [Kordia sp.]
MIITASEIQEILYAHKEDLSFILGNGINLHYQKDNVSWYNLLLDLWKEHADVPMDEIPEGISFIEFYDALGLQNVTLSGFSTQLQKDVKAKMLNWQPDDAQNLILNKIQAFNAPILTTNFDDLIPKSMKLNLHRIADTSFTDHYPWATYYANDKLNTPIDGFGVWYMNGMVKYHRSIKLGLSEYMGNVERARKMINSNYGYIPNDDTNPWVKNNTWIDIMFNKSLCIFGLSLDETEGFFRWLLIQRAKFFKRFPKYSHKGWYIMKKEKNNPKTVGKKFFLKSVGIEVIEVENYPTLYEDIWK